ncbi:hypothetical protein ASG01_14795 [Chryseobacterium sp. Leaf180]|uniref:hypothetical protein n=1 Tax=Chryseobacterium sp. Leaf180 TaxID=1736289 RepID=UPI0006F7D9ED|nr:hypothetical protein [Chryseobacterium sp. Leaf180]KQR90830.1 hypothetical protein ASG01_14795 [Chryseobacterium sp. Leaf180]
MNRIRLKKEKMNAVFVKHHLLGLPFDAVLHHFSRLDEHEHIHDHPFGFTSHVLKGSYVERIYEIHEDGTYTSSVHHRKEGTVHFVPASTIHELIELPEGECFTMILPLPRERETYFYRFEDGKAFKRRFNQRKFRPV